MPAERTLVALLRERAERDGAQRAYTWLADGERESAVWSYAALDLRARTVAAHLAARLAPGERVVLAFQPGLDFIGAFFGCLYAGMIAVPVPSVHPRRARERLDAVAGDCSPGLTLTAESALEGDPRAWRAPALRGDDIAFLQYTSGSTARPKGVRVTHANVLANLAAIHAAEANDASSRGLSWLPAYHDMGLVEGILQPLYGCFPAWLAPPSAFLQKPSRWLRAISHYRVTVSGAPDFAYALCTRRVEESELHGLDLRSWRVAYNGSEPIAAATLESFARRFARCGFDPAALRPVYGLAEATLLVTASPRGRGSPRSLLKPEASTLAVVSCGTPQPGTQLSIVDPEDGRELAEGEVGEICVQGPAVTSGYWGDTAPRSVLRTGDLGFLHQGELYVTGRIKDMIILRGRKLYPQDIERSVEGCHPLVCASGIVAFAVQDQHVDRLTVLAEVERTALADWPAALDAIAQAVFRRHDCAVATTVLVRRGTLPRTSSGKLMRFRCREAFLSGSLHELARADAARDEWWAA